jgi:hypothetical protein
VVQIGNLKKINEKSFHLVKLFFCLQISKTSKQAILMIM